MKNKLAKAEFEAARKRYELAVFWEKKVHEEQKRLRRELNERRKELLAAATHWRAAQGSA